MYDCGKQKQFTNEMFTMQSAHNSGKKNKSLNVVSTFREDQEGKNRSQTKFKQFKEYSTREENRCGYERLETIQQIRPLVKKLGLFGT